MKVRIYNRQTFESYFYIVKDIHFGKSDFVLEYEGGYTIAFDNEIYQSYILA
jgi:hypothetical protein